MMHRSSRIFVMGLTVALATTVSTSRLAMAEATQPGEVIEIEDEKCDPAEIWLEGGGCASCPLGYVADASQERCVEDPGWSTLPDPCQLDPTKCTGPTEPIPDPDVPETCQGPTPTGGSEGCRKCFECTHNRDWCIKRTDEVEANCKLIATGLAAKWCNEGIYSATETDRPIIDKLDWGNPLRYAEQMLHCVQGHLRQGDGGLFAECETRNLVNRRICHTIDCSDVCFNNQTDPEASSLAPMASVSTAPATTSDVLMRPVTVSLPTTHDGYLVDACRFWSRDCGLLAANQYCRNRYGRLSRAMAYQLLEDIGAQAPTKTLLGGEICDQDFCDAFGTITCSVDALPVRFEFPRLETGRLAYCDGSGATCGEPVADQLCREAFGKGSYASAESEDTDFVGAEPTVALDGSLCGGSDCRAFGSITCRSPQLLVQALNASLEDADGDGVPSEVDNCPYEPNSRLVGPPLEHQADSDFDGIGDACDPEPDTPAWIRRFKVAAQAANPTSSPDPTRSCRAKQLKPIAAWFDADVACVMANLESPDPDAFELCRARAAFQLAGDLNDVIERMRARGKDCSLTASPTAIFEMVDDLGAHAMLYYQLVLTRLDLTNFYERTLGYHVFERMVIDVPRAIRKASTVVKGKGIKRYEKFVARLANALATDFATIEAESATLGVRLYPDWLATNTFLFVDDVVEKVEAAN